MFRKTNNGYNEIKNPVNINQPTSKKPAPTDTSSKDEADKFSAKKFTLYGTSAAAKTETTDASASNALINRLFGYK